MRSFVIIACCLFTCAAAAADAPTGICQPLADIQKRAESHGAQWTALDHEQWQFLRGIAALSPETPPGLPYGDKAAIIKMGGNAQIVFIDGDQACSPMTAPKQLIDLLDDVARGVIGHLGQAL